MKNFASIVLAITIATVHGDYYWKDYYGEIPSDAFAGGLDGGGNPTFIGTTFYPENNWIFPTIILRGERHAFFGNGGKKQISENLTKILCARNHSLFRWIPTDTKKMRYLTGCRQINGGYQQGALLTIGRANHLGRTLTGRVADSAVNKWHGLWIHDLSYQNTHFTEFEVLTYNCSNPWAEEV